MWSNLAIVCLKPLSTADCFTVWTATWLGHSRLRNQAHSTYGWYDSSFVRSLVFFNARVTPWRRTVAIVYLQEARRKVDRNTLTLRFTMSEYKLSEEQNHAGTLKLCLHSDSISFHTYITFIQTCYSDSKFKTHLIGLSKETFQRNIEY